jgi:hypothetical protein
VARSIGSSQAARTNDFQFCVGRLRKGRNKISTVKCRMSSPVDVDVDVDVDVTG